MKCPRCNHEWDVRQSPCPRCKFYLGGFGRQRSTNSLAPAKEAPLEGAVPSLSSSERKTILRSDPLLEPANNKATSTPLANERTASLRSGSLLEPINEQTATPVPFSSTKRTASLRSGSLLEPANNKATSTPLANERMASRRSGSLMEPINEQAATPAPFASPKRTVSLRSGSLLEPIDEKATPAPFSNERMASLRSGPLVEPASDGSVQSPIPARTDQPRRSTKFPTTDRLSLKKKLEPIPNELSPSGALKPSSIVGWPSSAAPQADQQTLPPGTLLHRDRYRLQKTLFRQEWPLEIVETIWSGLDTRFTKSSVLLYELSVPENASHEVQAIPYTATKVFTTIGRYPHLLALRDVFREHGSSFYVFEPIKGLSLSTLMQKNGGTLSEPDVIAYCIQIADLLDICSKQSPPLVHGNIRPECIVRASANSQYILINFSVALAGGLAQVLANSEKTSSANIADLIRGKDTRTDLYALLATAHYTITGRPFSSTGSLATSANVSPMFRTILAKGLASPLQRYQKPSELYHDLLALRSKYGNMSLVWRNSVGEQNSQALATIPKREQQPQDSLVPVQPTKAQPEQLSLAGLPESLPVLEKGHDMRNAAIWFVVMLVCLGLVLIQRLLSK